MVNRCGGREDDVTGGATCGDSGGQIPMTILREGSGQGVKTCSFVFVSQPLVLIRPS